MNFSNNKAKKRFELEVSGQIAFVEYILAQNKIFLTHTEVPKSLSGQGIGSNIVLQVLQNIENMDLKIVPLCPFVAQYIKNHQEWKHLVSDSVKIK